MNFPGDNELKISSEAVKALLSGYIAQSLGDVRITHVSKTSAYGSDIALSVSFTTDPNPDPVPLPEPTPVIAIGIPVGGSFSVD